MCSFFCSKEIRYLMFKSYKARSFFSGLRFTCSNVVRENKGKLFLTFSLVTMAVFVGVFLAIKNNNSYNLGQLQEIDLCDFYSGVVASSSAFMSRCVSLVVNLLLLTALSFSPYLFPLAQVLFCFRGYLLGLNITLVFIFYGIGSIVTVIVVVIPCQLISLFLLVGFYLIFSKINSNCRRFGCCECNRFVFVISALALLLLVNLVETFLLVLLNGNVILVI